jgi:hypothetical protein
MTAISKIRKYECEPCPRCGHDLWWDEENDANHVIRDKRKRPVALTMLCLDAEGRPIGKLAFYG